MSMDGPRIRDYKSYLQYLQASGLGISSCQIITVSLPFQCAMLKSAVQGISLSKKCSRKYPFPSQLQSSIYPNQMYSAHAICMLLDVTATTAALAPV
jgi:hypothetical protein